MTLSQGYRMLKEAKPKKKPCLDYPYLGIPDEDDEDILSETQH